VQSHRQRNYQTTPSVGDIVNLMATDFAPSGPDQGLSVVGPKLKSNTIHFGGLSQFTLGPHSSGRGTPAKRSDLKQDVGQDIGEYIELETTSSATALLVIHEFAERGRPRVVGKRAHPHLNVGRYEQRSGKHTTRGRRKKWPTPSI